MESPGIIKFVRRDMVFFGTLCLCFFIGCNSNEMAMKVYTANGYIKDTAGQPVTGAIVMVVESPEPVSDIAAVTDSSGKFSLAHLTGAGKYVLQINHEGKSIKKTIELPLTETPLIINVR